MTSERGLPIGGAQLMLHGFDRDGNYHDTRPTSSAPDGTFRIPHVPPGTYSLVGQQAGMLTVLERYVSTASNETTHLDVTMVDERQGAVLTGRVTNFDAMRPKDSRTLRPPHGTVGGPVIEVVAVPLAREFIETELITVFTGDWRVYASVPEDGYGPASAPNPNEVTGRYRLRIPPGDTLPVAVEHGPIAEGLYVIFHPGVIRTAAPGATLRQDLTMRPRGGALEGTIALPDHVTGTTQRLIVLAHNQSDPADRRHFPHAVAWPTYGTRYRIPGLPEGTYTVRALVETSEGLVSAAVRNIEVKAGETVVQDIGDLAPNELPFGHLDVPAPGSTVHGRTLVHGWALDEKGVAVVTVLVDGRGRGVATLGDARPDVLAAFPAYARQATPGWHFVLETTALADGAHTLTVRLEDGNGATALLPSRTITVDNAKVTDKAPSDR